MAMCAGKRVQPASGGYRGAGGCGLVFYGAACQQGNGCSRPAGAIDALRPDAGCQLVLSGCWWFCAGAL